MTRIELKWLAVCGALAIGIMGARALPRAAELWSAALALAALVALLGFGFAVRGWGLAVVALLGVALTYRVTVQEELRYRESPWMRAVSRREARAAEPSALQCELSERVGLGIGHAADVAALNRAILLGERRRLPQRLKQVFVDSGAIHIFAISGLHVMVVAKIIMVGLAVCFVPCRWQGALAVPLLWGYVVLIGHPPSAVRAALMATFYFGASIVWRRPNGPIAWALSFLVLHLAAPCQLTNVGSVFSFAVMFVLIVAGRVIRLPRQALAQMLVLTFAAWAAGVPIAAATFGRLTPGGLLANLVLVSTAVYTVVAGVVGLLASFVWEPLAVHLNNLAAVVTELMVGIATSVARLPGASFASPQWGVWECVGWYLALGLSFYLVRHVQQRHDRL